jgi:O-antigen ligase
LLIYPAYRVILLNKRINFSLIELSRGIKSSGGDIKNIDERTREWYSAIQLIKKKPLLGYGNDYQEKLIQRYMENGFGHEASNRFNAHNQFLETQLQFGMPGTVILLWILFGPFLSIARSPYPFLYKVFFVLITVNFIFESMLVRQWGIMFFLIFYLLLSKWTIITDQAD